MILNNLYKLKFVDFDIKNIEVYKITNEIATIDYTVSPRKSNLLHFITNGKREYEIKGEKFTVESNTLIFIPNNTKYKTKALSGNAGIGICFNGDIFKEEKDFYVYCKNLSLQSEKIKSLFEKASDVYNTVPCDFLELKLTIIKILSILTQTENPEEYSLIKDAVAFINKRYKENLPVKVYADNCNLSESYFRKKFSKLLGKSPIEYRNELRFRDARHLYRKGLSTEEIAETLGFCDARYMLKLYRSHTGKSLKKDAEII